MKILAICKLVVVKRKKYGKNDLDVTCSWTQINEEASILLFIRMMKEHLDSMFYDADDHVIYIQVRLLHVQEA